MLSRIFHIPHSGTSTKRQDVADPKTSKSIMIFRMHFYVYICTECPVGNTKMLFIGVTAFYLSYAAFVMIFVSELAANIKHVQIPTRILNYRSRQVHDKTA